LSRIESYSQFIWEHITKTPQKIILVGHSMGGAISMDFALRHPEFVEGLVLISTGAKLRVNPNFLDSVSQGKHPLNLINYLYSASASPTLKHQSLEEMKKVPTDVYWSDFLACDGFNCVSEINSLHVPTLILCGEEDQMTPLKYSQFLHESISGSIFKPLPGTGHMCMLEKPDEVSQAIEEFILTFKDKD
jgi:pimeloyl-ACP methyl ester carboxylesterase